MRWSPARSGRMVQIETHCARKGRAIPVMHTVELLDQAMQIAHHSPAPIGTKGERADP